MLSRCLYSFLWKSPSNQRFASTCRLKCTTSNLHKVMSIKHSESTCLKDQFRPSIEDKINDRSLASAGDNSSSSQSCSIDISYGGNVSCQIGSQMAGNLVSYLPIWLCFCWLCLCWLCLCWLCLCWL